MGAGKFFRFLRREHPTKAGFTLPVVALTAGAGVLTVMTGGVAAPILIAPAITAMAGLIFSIGEGPGSSNSDDINGCKLVGSPKDIHRVKRVQELINKWTAEKMHEPVLPEKLRQKIMRHVGDATEALARLRVYEDTYKGAPVDSFSFTRSFFDADGLNAVQKIAIIDLKPIEMVEAAKPVQLSVPVKFVPPPQAEQQRALPAPDTLKVQFGTKSMMQQQVEDMIAAQMAPLQERIAELEGKKLKPKEL